MTKRLKRGDVSLDMPGMIFLRYRSGNGKEEWVTRESFDRATQAKRKSNARQRAKPGHKKKMREYFRGYNKRPHQKERMATYYSKPEIRAKYNAKYAASPQRKIDRIERERKHAEWEAYKQSPEYSTKKRAVQKAYEKKNRLKINAYAKKRRENPQVRIADNCRRMIRSALKRGGWKKYGRTESLIGCSFAELKQHIESQFTAGMSWELLMEGKIEIHHIIPLASFRLESEEAQRAAFNWSNQKPLWATANRQLLDKMVIDGKTVLGRNLRKQNIIPFKAA